MARAIHWRVPFVALDNTAYQVNIYEEGYQGNVVVLKGGAQPFVTEETDDEDAFLPLRTSSGYLTIVCEEYALVDAILPSSVHDRYVELVDVTTNSPKVVWNGFVMPEEYSGDWNRPPFELSLPVASPIGASLALAYNATSKAVMIGEVLREILKDIVGVVPTYIMSGKFPSQTASMLTAMFSGTAFMKFPESDGAPAYGNGQSVKMGDEQTTVGDVLEAFCRLYGYVMHETPDALWFCSSDMSTDYYQAEINYDTTQPYATSEDVVSMINASFPSVASADNTRTLLPGKSAVRVYCEAQKVTELLNGDFGELEPVDYWEQRITSVTEDKGCRMYVRGNTLGKQAFQYDSRETQFYDMNMFKDNYTHDDRELWGGNFISLLDWKSPNIIYREEFGKYKNYLLLASSFGDHQSRPLRLCARFRSAKPYSAINFTNQCLKFNLKCKAAKDWDTWDAKFKYSRHLVMAIKWGDYTYSPIIDTWGNPVNDYRSWSNSSPNALVEYVLSARDDYNPQGPFTPSTSDEGETEILTVREYRLGSGWISVDVEEGVTVVVPAEIAAQMYGYIEIDFYNIYEQDGIKYILLSDISLSHPEFSQQAINDTTNHYLSDFRRRLTNDQDEEYEYKQVLNNLMSSYSPSGVIPPTLLLGASSDYYEQTILSRLASWYDRTIEQINVTVQNSGIAPGQRVVRGNDKYIVVSKAHNWRDGMVTLTMQKLYEQAQA